MVKNYTKINKLKNNPVHVEVHRIQHYVIKLISDFWQVGGFLWLIHQQNWPPWYNWNIVENTITLTLTLILQFCDWILKLFGQCCIFVLHFLKTFMFPCIWWIKIQNVYWLLIIDFELVYTCNCRFCTRHGPDRQLQSFTPPQDLLIVAEIMMPRIILRLLHHLRDNSSAGQ